LGPLNGVTIHFIPRVIFRRNSNLSGAAKKTSNCAFITSRCAARRLISKSQRRSIPLIETHRPMLGVGITRLSAISRERGVALTLHYVALQLRDCHATLHLAGLRQLARYQHRRKLLMHEIERHPAEQPLANPRMTKGAGDDEIGVLSVEWANKPSTARSCCASPRPPPTGCTVWPIQQLRRNSGLAI
jgi:hypothetical protein